MVEKDSLIDIIIPVYNAKKTLLRTLCSLALQKNFDKFKVYLVVDCDDSNYDYEMDFVKDYLDITLYRLDKNVGPGQARQYGINNSSSPYIMFIDSDDYLYDAHSLYEISKVIKDDSFDLIISNFIYQRDNEITIKKLDNTWLHGKVYNRKFLIDNDIEFNNTRANEDNGFNRLIMLNIPRQYFFDYVTYVYSENSESITRRNNRSYKFTSLEDLAFNINWAISKVINKERSIPLVASTSYSLLYALYYYYNELFDEYDVSKILKWSKDSLLYFNKYSNILSEDEKNELCEIKKKEYESKNIVLRLSFDDFIKKVSEYDD